LRGHPEAAGPCEQHRLALAVDLTDVLHRAREARTPPARDDELPAGPLRRVHGPLIAPIPVQLAEEQVQLLFATAEDVLGGVWPVVDEGRAAVAFGVIARKKDRVRGEWRVGLPVAVQRLDEGDAFRPLLSGTGRVQAVG